ncbi:MAG TPA: heme b synthase [Thermoleophilia bacterium]|nr:heme b synthase [Thermoleophilia bacterium]
MEVREKTQEQTEEIQYLPKLIAWEVTRSCNLSCRHCRASAEKGPYPGELTTAQGKALVDDIAAFANPVLIMTGGDPLMREDIWELAEYAIHQAGLRVVMSPNGTLVTPEAARKMKEVGIPRISISIDFPTAEMHDEFRGVSGAFEGAVRGVKTALEAGVQVQINSTITKLNVDFLDDLLNLSKELGAVAFHPFLLVPTGRGKQLGPEELPPEDYERTLNWVYERQKTSDIFFKPTDAPHYHRIMRQRAKEDGTDLSELKMHPHSHAMMAGGVGRSRGHGDMDSHSKGCLAGTGFCFISHTGKVQPCGYFDVVAGDVKQQPFSEIWRTSELFGDLRDVSKLKGKCGICEYRRVCGGCRARAYEITGDYLAEEPYCVYEPVRQGC